MDNYFDRSKTLQELENCDWGEPNWESELVLECHRLRRIPLNQFKIEDLRRMIGQRIGLPYLIPIAVERLEEDPLAEGMFYRGDLLSAVLTVEKSFWAEDQALFNRMCQVAIRAKALLPSLDEFDDSTVRTALRNASAAFQEFTD